MFEAFEYRVGRRWAWLATAAVLVAGAAEAQPAYPVTLEQGALEPALLSLATQTKQQIMFSKGVVAGRQAPAVKGRLTPEQALELLLAGTDLRARRVNANLVVVDRPAPGAANSRPFEVASVADGAVREATLLDEVQVTGSNLRGVAPASPVTVLDRDDLERSGHTTIADALRALPSNFGGGAQESFGTGADRLSRNGSFGSALNLRGLGNNATLVLMNGHRIAGSGTFADFVDISSIPAAAVDRVEVLLDGASALYGSDAVGGVVNFIMRREFDGAEVRLLGGTSTQGGRAQGQVDLTFGRTWEDGGLLVAYELRRQDDLLGSQRPFAGDADLRQLGGTDQRLTSAFPGNILLPDPVTRALVPTYAIPAGQNGVGLRPSDFIVGAPNRFNQRQGADVLPKQTLNSLYAAGHQAVGRVELAGDLRYASRRYKNINVPRPATFTVGRGNPFFVSPTGAASHQISYSFGEDVPNPTAYGTSDTLAATLSATLDLKGGWRSEAYAAFAQQQDENRGAGVVNTVILNEALGNTPDNPATAYSAARHGVFNPFNGIAGAGNVTALGYINSGTVLTRSRDRVSSVNLQADGPLWSLPAGPVKLAVGAQARREGFETEGTIYVASTAPVRSSSLDLDRTVLAAFGELQIPIVGPDNAKPGLQRLELSVAGRIEHYETFETSANPKLGVVWSPVDGLRVRGTYGRSFRAPGLREVADPSLYNPQLLALGAGRVVTLTLSGGNPDLKPETANSWTLGFDWQPASIPGLSVSATGFDIRFKNRIDKPVSANQANALQDPNLATFVTRISPATSASDLALIQSLLADPAFSNATGSFPAEQYGAILDNRYVNAASVKVRGVDMTARYSFDVGGDTIALAGNATYMLDFEQQLTPTSAVVERVNRINFPVRFRSRVTADWTRGRLTLGGAFNYVVGYRDDAGVKIGDQPTFDLQARLAAAKTGPLAGVSALLNVRNVFDRDPPFYNNSVGIGYDAANADPIGRYVSLQLTRSW
ncbi:MULTISPECIES: TonB-dependent receptor [unclassified Phenylobacterium]|uniref:TonB-dependent receptor n=1 Tax=unclassified Phenylobacterium TaxID=2640670 RepID=UPI00083AE0F0|nr:MULTISPECIES: TonB-dependent receptor [unclassified Phenylobacterium]